MRGVEKPALGACSRCSPPTRCSCTALPLAALLGVAGLAHLARWVLWQPWKTLRTPLVWVLHAGLRLDPGAPGAARRRAARLGPAVGGPHALTVGAVGGLVIGMMTRTARGHTGRPLRRRPRRCRLLRAGARPRWCAWSCRSSRRPRRSAAVLLAALWSAGFGLYALRYWPVLTRPRLDGRPGGAWPTAASRPGSGRRTPSGRLLSPPLPVDAGRMAESSGPLCQDAAAPSPRCCWLAGAGPARFGIGLALARGPGADPLADRGRGADEPPRCAGLRVFRIVSLVDPRTAYRKAIPCDPLSDRPWLQSEALATSLVCDRWRLTVLALVACERRAAVESVVAPPSSAVAPSSTGGASTASASTGGTALSVPASAPGGAAADRYDVSKMDFKPPRAVLTTERHTGAFAAGSALSMDAAVKPLDPAPVKEIRLDTTHKIIEIAPGVKFSAWTFGDQVPGPVVRARVGDRIKFTMTNRSDEPVPGVRVTAAPMMHSMDFHSAMVSPQDKYRSIAPGQTISFEFTPNYPGVFMYHCGTPMVLEHIASGMYGMMIVEPRGGYPDQGRPRVRRHPERVLHQARSAEAQGRRRAALRARRRRACARKAPTYTVFNGRYNGMVDKPLPAKPGERVRLFVLNVGPSNTSSFHVVGTIFDRVWIEGNPDNQFRGMQTVLLGSSNGAIVEFMIPEAGTYVMVDHHFANASQGAIGLIAAGGKRRRAQRPRAPQHPGHRGADRSAARRRASSRSNRKCLACHSIAGGDKLGPDLYGVTKRRDEAWLARWLKTPEQMLQTDPIAKADARQVQGADAQPEPDGRRDPRVPRVLQMGRTRTCSPRARPAAAWRCGSARRHRRRYRPRRCRAPGRRASHEPAPIRLAARCSRWRCSRRSHPPRVSPAAPATRTRSPRPTTTPLSDGRPLQGRVMVFCEVRGPLDSRRLKAVASRVKGLDATSLRTSAPPRRCTLRSIPLSSRRRRR